MYRTVEIGWSGVKVPLPSLSPNGQTRAERLVCRDEGQPLRAWAVRRPRRRGRRFRMCQGVNARTQQRHAPRSGWRDGGVRVATVGGMGSDDGEVAGGASLASEVAGTGAVVSAGFDWNG